MAQRRRFGADGTVICHVLGRQALSPKMIENNDLMWVVGKLSRFDNDGRPDAIFVDVDGTGAAVVDRIRQLGHDTFNVNLGIRTADARRAKMRARMWSGPREWLQKDGILPHDQRLLAGIISPNDPFDAPNRIKLERKDEMKARLGQSPDLADALTFAAAAVPASRPSRRQSCRGSKTACPQSRLVQWV